jgi:CubicO group peptidase (beta-lactamase class C family)
VTTDHTAARLDRRLAEAQRSCRLPSVVAGLVRHGALVWSGGAGEVDGRAPTAETQYRIGSITKTFVAVAVLRLRDAGRLSLDDHVGNHVDDAPVPDATVGQLLAHAAGLQAETDGPWWERTAGGPWADLAASVPDPARHPRGVRFHYSNVGYAVLGELLARHHGCTWDEVIRRELLDPLGMTRTTPRPEPPAARGFAVHPWADVLLPEPEHDAGAMAPAGQLWSTVEDLGRWAALLAGHRDDLVATATLTEASRPRVVDDRPGLPWTAAHGLGVQVWNHDGRRTIGHGGSMPGFLAVLSVDVDTGDGVVVAANTTRGLDPALTTDLLEVLWEEEPAVAPWRPANDTSLLELTGVWYWGPAPTSVRASGEGELLLAPMDGPGRTSRFVPDADGGFVGLDGYYAGERLRVVRDDRGRARALDLASFVFTREPYGPTVDVPGGTAPWGV